MTIRVTRTVRDVPPAFCDVCTLALAQHSEKQLSACMATRARRIKVGDRFGSRVVVRFERYEHPTFGKKALVRCDCGSERVLYANRIYQTTTCGKKSRHR